MGAQSSLLSLVNTATSATGTAISGVSKVTNTDSQMADYARKMRDAKLETARNNAKMSKLRLDKMKKVIGGEK
ncbi:MAG: hypothetical protein J6T10_23530 [Methanobrevibacter sp.]|nr:hypothetical protein [Methanobrevibacter sp.]